MPRKKQRGVTRKTAKLAKERQGDQKKRRQKSKKIRVNGAVWLKIGEGQGKRKGTRRARQKKKKSKKRKQTSDNRGNKGRKELLRTSVTLGDRQHVSDDWLAENSTPAIQTRFMPQHQFQEEKKKG